MGDSYNQEKIQGLILGTALREKDKYFKKIFLKIQHAIPSLQEQHYGYRKHCDFNKKILLLTNNYCKNNSKLLIEARKYRYKIELRQAGP